jgi:hypothetical protein
VPFGKEKDKDAKADESAYRKLRLSAAKDILDAESPQALDKALHEYFRACVDEESE